MPCVTFADLILSGVADAVPLCAGKGVVPFDAGHPIIGYALGVPPCVTPPKARPLISAAVSRCRCERTARSAKFRLHRDVVHRGGGLLIAAIGASRERQLYDVRAHAAPPASRSMGESVRGVLSTLSAWVIWILSP
jgi:hypothetical protein